MPRFTFPFGVLFLATLCPAQGGNEKTFYSGQTSGSVRDSSSATDRLYFMQPQMARYGYGRGTGFRGVFQDQEQRTAETIRIAFVRYAQDKIRPGTVVSEATYKIFGTGSGAAAYRFTFTLGTPAVLPNTIGIRATLPPPNGWPSDGVSMHYQNGNTTKIPAGVSKPQWTWRLVGTTISAFSTPASTVFLGGLYDEGVTRVFISSTAYGTRQDLFGAEALYPDPARGDRLGFSLSHDGFKSKLGIVVISPAFVAPVPVAPFGTLLVNLIGSVFLPATALDSKGNAKTVAIPVPPGTRFSTQSLFLDATSSKVRLSDAARVEGR